MRNWDKEIKQAKEETIQARIDNWKESWRKQWCKEHRKSEAYVPKPPRPPKEVSEVKAWFITQWDTGFIVCDMQELMKQPKRKRDKILCLGGIS